MGISSRPPPSKCGMLSSGTPLPRCNTCARFHRQAIPGTRSYRRSGFTEQVAQPAGLGGLGALRPHARQGSLSGLFRAGLPARPDPRHQVIQLVRRAVVRPAIPTWQDLESGALRSSVIRIIMLPDFPRRHRSGPLPYLPQRCAASTLRPLEKWSLPVLEALPVLAGEAVQIPSHLALAQGHFADDPLRSGHSRPR